MLKRPKECLYQQKTVVCYMLGISGNIKMVAFLKQSFEREKKKYLKARLDQCRHFSPLWFHVMECLDMKPRY